MPVLTELQRDALTEAFNLGMGAAACALSEMVDEEVVLCAPSFEFLKKADAVAMLNSRSLDSVSGVTQRFSGPFEGQAMLLFAGDKSLELVRSLLQNTAPLDRLTEFEEDALNEIGNIILNAGLSSLGNIFEQEIYSDLPVYFNGSFDELMGLHDRTDEGLDTLMLLRIDFRLAKREIEGYVIFLLSMGSVNRVVLLIDRFLEKITT